ncbi:cyclophilin [Plasmodium gonderi]|uniref:Cyclophilin n=1 Tax=Plasmodium gonderi TaxID=77519 RepID=A0A1Y1JL60_PLAGO|nr:cyclophilin [Plasmodium gonderi]GAW82990.1 cyclophilin [Plasmodium gonderi]
MSEVYSIEPKTSGRVIIYTSLGELEVLLFCNECPIACQNFIQLCLNNYYNKNKFFRVIPKFLIQTGDHTNTGLHNEYAFKEPFKNEYNSRLKFLYTGCISFANLNIEKPSNGSQFFITLDKAEYLNNKSTLFGKVAKHSIYNLLKFNNIKTNKNDEPIEDIPYIEYIKIVENPFHHLVPYANYDKDDRDTSAQEIVTKSTKKLKSSLLSFGYDEVEDEEAASADVTSADVTSAGVTSADVAAHAPLLPDRSHYHHEKWNQTIQSAQDEEQLSRERTDDTPRESVDMSEMTIQACPKERTQKENPEINKNDNKLDVDKINMLKKRTKDIEKSATNKKKNHSGIRDLVTLDDAYLRKMKKYKKMSKSEREKQSLKKLEEFDSRLKDLFSGDGEKSQGVKHDWLNTEGLKFKIDSTNAYEYEDIKKNMINPMENEKKRPYDSKFSVQKYLKEKQGKKRPFKVTIGK